MKGIDVASHLLAVVLGGAVAATAFPRGGGEAGGDLGTTVGRAEEVRARSGGRVRSGHPRELLKELKHRSMESRHRISLIQRLEMDWAEDDPRGFLEWYRDQVDEESPWSDASGKAIKRLAREDPGWLLAYGERAGNSGAIWGVAHYGDPEVILGLFFKRGEAEWPEGWVMALFERGLEIDPEFHRHLFDLESAELREAAARSYLTVMLERSEPETFARWLAAHSAEVAAGDLARELGVGMGRKGLDASALLLLAEAERSLAVEGVLGELVAPSDPDARSGGGS